MNKFLTVVEDGKKKQPSVRVILAALRLDEVVDDLLCKPYENVIYLILTTRAQLYSQNLSIT